MLNLKQAAGLQSFMRDIDLPGQHLTTLPAWLEQCSDVEKLYRDGNELTALPESVSQLTNLKTLYAMNNHLSQACGRLLVN